MSEKFIFRVVATLALYFVFIRSLFLAVTRTSMIISNEFDSITDVEVAALECLKKSILTDGSNNVDPQMSNRCPLGYLLIIEPIV